MPVLHKEGLVQPVRVLQLHIEHWIKMAPHHRPNWITRGKIPHDEGDEGHTDDNEEEADEPFDQELNHSTPLAPLKEVVIVFKTACLAGSAISIPIVHRSSIISVIKRSVHETAPFHRQKLIGENNKCYINELLLILSDISTNVKQNTCPDLTPNQPETNTTMTNPTSIVGAIPCGRPRAWVVALVHGGLACFHTHNGRP